MSAIQADIQSKILPGITHWASPRFMAFFACSSSHPAAIAEMYITAFNGSHFNWICSPAATELETIVMDWLAQALSLPSCFLSGGPTGGGGVIHGAASEALLTVMVAARDRYLAEVMAHVDADMDEEQREDELWRRRSKLVALGSAGSHSSSLKAAKILGVRYMAVPVSEESGWAMTGEAVAGVLAKLEAKGLEPFYLTATLGTTDVCAVDDFEGITRVLEQRQEQQEGRDKANKRGNVWVHVDAAWAGAALLLPENQHLTTSLHKVDSFNVNPHKWMLTAFDCSALWVRKRGDLINAMSVKPPYLRNQFSDGELVTDYRDWQMPLGRRFRSLKLWFVMRSYGLRGLQDHIRRHIELAEVLQKLLSGRDDLFTIFTEARFALVSFRVRGDVPGAPATEEEKEKRCNEMTEKLYNAVNDGGEFFLTSTVIQGKFVIRVCTGVERVAEQEVQRLFELFVELIDKITQG
jgi:aromatic-L-amino-acid/L-tryptophan decarboxylase